MIPGECRGKVGSLLSSIPAIYLGSPMGAMTLPWTMTLQWVPSTVQTDWTTTTWFGLGLMHACSPAPPPRTQGCLLVGLHRGLTPLLGCYVPAVAEPVRLSDSGFGRWCGTPTPRATVGSSSGCACHASSSAGDVRQVVPEVAHATGPDLRLDIHI